MSFNKSKKRVEESDDSDSSPEEVSFNQEDDDDQGSEEDQTQNVLAAVPFSKRMKLNRLGIPQIDKEEFKNQRDKQYDLIRNKKRKDAPTEMSSKLPVSRYQQVVQPPPKPKARDPRFDDLSGKFNKDLFDKSYKFIENIQQREMDDMERQIQAEEDSYKKSRLQENLKRMKLRWAQEKKQKQQEESLRAWKKNEKEMVAAGRKNPYYLKNSDARKMELVSQYNKLKDNPHQLEKFMAKRREKKAKKEHKFLPYRR